MNESTRLLLISISLLSVHFQFFISLHDHTWLSNVFAPFHIFLSLSFSNHNGHNTFHILHRILVLHT
jgi:hypothetical protein